MVSWRLLASDAPDAQFTLFRDGHEIADSLREGTNFVDREGSSTSRYAVLPSANDAAQSAPVWPSGYLSIPVDQPAGGTAPDGTAYSYEINDGSVGDLDGDGRYEIVIKWYPSIAKDNAFAGYTGNTLFDAYKLDGTRLWRIDMGPNIRSGAHYTQFLVFDFDGDGRAEMAAKTADGTIDGAGNVIGEPKADWREREGEVVSTDRTGSRELPDGRRVASLTGRILKGPEYLTVFEGRTGRVADTKPYWPSRHPQTANPSREQLEAVWGDGYANRSERYLAGVAFLNGVRPSIVMARGYYGRTALGAWDFRSGRLIPRWQFDSSVSGYENHGGQGNHQLAVGDVNNDGKDEILYGSLALDDDGKPLWNANLLHGDAMHVSDHDPSRPGLEKWGVHENVSRNGGIGAAMLDARSGEILWSTKADKDTGRGLAADIDPRHPGAEAWASNADILYTVRGEAIGRRPRQVNFAIWWDGDLSRELLDGTTISKWDAVAQQSSPLIAPEGLMSNNGTKANPVLSADIIGDWREEVIWRAEDNRSIRIYTTPHPTAHRITTLMHDPIYRLSVAWQNVAYNQPPHTSYFLGTGMKKTDGLPSDKSR